MPCPYNSPWLTTLSKFSGVAPILRNLPLCKRLCGMTASKFWHTQVYDPAGGFLSSRPYYLEATPGFEIRVHASDLQRANDALEWVESKENVPTAPGDHSRFDDNRFASQQTLPFDWDSNGAHSKAC